jgi:hypothetical protein
MHTETEGLDETRAPLRTGVWSASVKVGDGEPPVKAANHSAGARNVTN